MPSPRSPVVLALLVVLAAGVLACGALVGLVFHTLFPSSDDFLVRNDTDAEITDVRLLRWDGGPADEEAARFPRIGPHASVLAEDAGTGRFSLEFSDARGRWIATRVCWLDSDDVRGREPHVLCVSDGRVGDVPARPAR